MDILQLIDRLEEIFNEAKTIPLTHNVMVDEDRMLELIDQMRIAIPEEVKKAQQVVTQRDRVMAQAQEEANRTLQLSRDKAEQLIQKDMIVQDAQRLAEHVGEAPGVRLLRAARVIRAIGKVVRAGVLRIPGDVVERCALGFSPYLVRGRSCSRSLPPFARRRSCCSCSTAP